MSIDRINVCKRVSDNHAPDCTGDQKYGTATMNADTYCMKGLTAGLMEQTDYPWVVVMRRRKGERTVHMR